MWSGYLSRYSYLLWAGRSGDRIPAETRFFAYVQTSPGTNPASCKICTGSFPGAKRLGRGVDHLLLLASRSRMSRAITLLPLWAFGACYRAKFTIWIQKQTLSTEYFHCLGSIPCIFFILACRSHTHATYFNIKRTAFFPNSVLICFLQQTKINSLKNIFY
jgi:hypothetical protein